MKAFPRDIALLDIQKHDKVSLKWIVIFNNFSARREHNVCLPKELKRLRGINIPESDKKLIKHFHKSKACLTRFLAKRRIYGTLKVPSCLRFTFNLFLIAIVRHAESAAQELRNHQIEIIFQDFSIISFHILGCQGWGKWRKKVLIV